MATNSDNLMQSVLDYFLNLYHQNSGAPAGSTFLSFEPIGTHITSNMFKLHSTDASYSPALAVEQFSNLTNTIPAIDSETFQRTAKTVEEFYDLLLEGSFPAAVDSSDEVTVFSTFKAKAKQNFDNMQLGSLLKPLTQFHPAYATPNDWYDASLDANWTNYASQDQTSSQSSSGAPGRPQNWMPLAKPPWKWQVLSPELVPILEHPEVIDRLSTVQVLDLKNIAAHPDLDTSKIDTSSIVLKTELEASLRKVLKVDLATDLGQVVQVQLPASRLQVVSIAGMSLLAPTKLGQVASVNPVNRGIASSIPISRIPIDQIPIKPVPSQPAPNLPVEKIVPISSPVIQAARLGELLKQTSQQSVVSTNLTVSFKYCLVEIDRSWLSQAYLATKGWYVPGYAQGGFSTGTPSNNAGVFPVLPIAFIVIKDLQIASWSDSETDMVTRSAGFGPFSLVGRTVDRRSNTLIEPGMQIIGWVCQIMPFLPPAAPVA